MTIYRDHSRTAGMPSMEEIERAIKQSKECVISLAAERDRMLTVAPTPPFMKAINEYYGDCIARVERDILTVQTLWAHRRDALNEAPEEAAQRDGIAMALLVGW